jgi:alkylated DNA repair dioxygenase AlkB
MAVRQIDMFGAAPKLPEGFRYAPDVLSEANESQLLVHVASLPFTEFLFQGFVGKRRTVSYGWRYDFTHQRLEHTSAIPDFLLPLQASAGAFSGVAPESLQQVIVTEYASGAGIGWHKDKAVFGDVIGISLRTACNFRLRRRTEAGWERAGLIAEPRSMYLLRGPSRTAWEHSIPGVDALRYSITFRNFR